MRHYFTVGDALLTLRCKVVCKALHAGMYLHVYPLCSVNSLHLHVVRWCRLNR
jgi:hypothetical protein